MGTTARIERMAPLVEANPRAALVFYWDELDRQVRITDGVALASTEESERYFRSRLHDRIQYVREKGGRGWRVERLSP